MMQAVLDTLTQAYARLGVGYKIVRKRCADRTFLRTLQATDLAGIRAFVVHAKDDEARAFYERYGFASSPTDPYHLFVLLKDVRATLGG